MDARIIALIVFIILLIYVIYQYSLNKNTHSVVMDGKQETTILATDLETSKSSTGHTYSIWMFIDDWNYRNGEKKYVFLRGGIDTTNLVSEQCPGIYLGEYDNDLVVEMMHDNNSNPIKSCKVSNIPIQKWVNITTVVSGRTLDIYIDGKLVNTCLLPGNAKTTDTDNVYITPMGGFSGYTSKFQYYDSALTSTDVWDIYMNGYGGTSYISSLINTKLNITISDNGIVEKTYTI